MQEQLVDDVALPNMDWYLPELYAFLEAMGVTVLINKVSRYVVDPNRRLSAHEGESYKTNLIYMRTTMGNAMYRMMPSNAESKQRISDYYMPYHCALQNLLLKKKKYFGKAYLFDLHSFGADLGADTVVGNGKGATSSPEFFSMTCSLLENEGFRVQKNEPFSGGYITTYYGAESDCDAVQLELWYGAYIAHRTFGDEEFPEKDMTVFKAAQIKMEHVFRSLLGYLK